MASRSINIYSPLVRPLRTNVVDRSPSISCCWQQEAGRFSTQRSLMLYCTAQDSSTATVTDKKEAESTKAVAAAAAAAAAEAPNSSPTSTVTDKKEAEKVKAPAAKAAPAKPKKAPAKPLPVMMEEDVIPSLKTILEAQEDISQIELSFQDNRLEGSFLKKDIPYYFWAFFPDGSLTGPKGFSLSSHGSEASTVEPFLIDERKITDKHVVFWVKKRLAAQAIIPVWEEE